MSRFLACRNVRRFTRAIHKTTCFEVFHPTGSPYPKYNFFSHYRHVHSRQTVFMLFESKVNFFMSSNARNLYTLPANNAKYHHCQVVWNRMCFHKGPALPPRGQIARVVSLAMVKSNFVVHGVIAFIIGELAWTQGKWAEAEFPTRDLFYVHAQDGRVYLTTALFAAIEVFILFLRAVYLVILFSPCIAMAPFVDSFGTQFRKTWIHVVRVTLEKAGSAFIKWGQWAATRPDLFPRDLCDELAEFQTKAPSHKFSYSRKCIENAFGRKLYQIFEKFEEEPVASGSIAQVHRATLRYKFPGQQIKPVDVAVKVRHPGVSEAIRRDFVLINLVAKISSFVPNLKWLRLDESIQQFAVFMMSQVDLSREAAHLSRFIYNFRRWKDVSFPLPLYPLVHPSVLVETFEQGESVLNYVDHLEGHEHFKSALAHIGTHALLKMLLMDNFIHADMHPGNILVREGKSKLSPVSLLKSRPHVIFLDVGMITELSKRERDYLLEFFKAVALQDGRAAAECTLRLSKQQNCPDPKSFVEEVDKSFKLWRSAEGESIRTADRMEQLLEHVRRCKVNIDGNVCAVIVTTLVLEGWQRRLDPEYDVLNALQTLLFKADLAESLSDAIEGLVAP
ncbi:probable serine/threonine-protein kinase abkC isoform X1 [Vigna unguiculata]|uniref:probable serine/threonine-protein kinase abkC isoform X1 n=1 Tax=Vigna unguiculata TaxID=3917 RepID=UPI0010164BD7|nr:probable serine/threonine-protein kinase abkC isoform X1 [Vigna unguiculata]